MVQHYTYGRVYRRLQWHQHHRECVRQAQASSYNFSGTRIFGRFLSGSAVKTYNPAQSVLKWHISIAPKLCKCSFKIEHLTQNL